MSYSHLILSVCRACVQGLCAGLVCRACVQGLVYSLSVYSLSVQGLCAGLVYRACVQGLCECFEITVSSSLGLEVFSGHKITPSKDPTCKTLPHNHPENQCHNTCWRNTQIEFLAS